MQVEKNHTQTIRYRENKSKWRQGDTGGYMKIQKAIVFFVSISSKGEVLPLETPFVGEMIMEEKEKLIVFFLSRIGSGAWPLVNPLFHVCFVTQGFHPLPPPFL